MTENNLDGSTANIDPEGVNGSVDPFGEAAPAVQLIVSMRIYDVLMAIYTDTNPEGARQLFELHAQGKIMGSLPYLDLQPSDFEEG